MMLSQRRILIFVPVFLFTGTGCGGSGKGEDADADAVEAPDALDDEDGVVDGDETGDGTDFPDGLDMEDASEDAAEDMDEPDGPEPPVPPLRPVTEEEAAALGAYARRLHVLTGGVLSANAWSMINTSCQERALALEYALAAAETPLGDQPPPMSEDELTAERIGELAANPAFDSASINITGPLVAEQTLVLPDGTSPTGDPISVTWPYHHGVVISVNGELRVLDLSVGDEPMPIDAWAHGFVDPAVPCFHMDEDEYNLVWGYWLAVHNSWVPDERPERLCGYTLTPVFTWRWDQDPLVDAIRFTPGTMLVQFEGFKTVLRTSYGITLADEEIPLVTSIYAPLPESVLCEWMDLAYCDTL